jgi:hypothetical protein
VKHGTPTNVPRTPRVDPRGLAREVVLEVRPLDGLGQLYQERQQPSTEGRQGKQVHPMQEQETKTVETPLLIESERGRFGCTCVTHLVCEERLALLERAADAGWELITRGVHWFDKTDHKGNVTGEEPEEFWYFRRPA